MHKPNDGDYFNTGFRPETSGKNEKTVTNLINMLSSKTTNGLEKTKRQLENLTWKRANDNVVWGYQDHQIKRHNFGFFLAVVIKL